MNNRFVINYTPGPTFLHQLSGFTKVFLFIVMTVAIIATYDVRILWPLCIISVIEMVSMKPNWKPIIFMFLFTFITVTVIGNIMLFVVSPDAGTFPKNGSGISMLSGSNVRLPLLPSWPSH